MFLETRIYSVVQAALRFLEQAGQFKYMGLYVPTSD